MQKSLEIQSEIIPAPVVAFVESEMSKYEHADNMRICAEEQTNLTKTTKNYETARQNGCCGFVDYQSFKFEGKNYIFGFNFGH